MSDTPPRTSCHAAKTTTTKQVNRAAQHLASRLEQEVKPVSEPDEVAASAATEAASDADEELFPGLSGTAADAVPLLAQMLSCIVRHRERRVDSLSVHGSQTAAQTAVDRADLEALHALLTLRARIDLVACRLPRIRSNEPDAIRRLAQVLHTCRSFSASTQTHPVPIHPRSASIYLPHR